MKRICCLCYPVKDTKKKLVPQFTDLTNDLLLLFELKKIQLILKDSELFDISLLNETFKQTIVNHNKYTTDLNDSIFKILNEDKKNILLMNDYDTNIYNCLINFKEKIYNKK